ncbi:hypothetical protein P2Q00_42510 [Streptomyces coacervatus]|uniref:hypothetical protein n=1 Tax=Streptomyces coacervatus TaxID=647381 RepID=UPI0023DBF80F|nr:hypothetical protein [Streptomyces coacervatus]MDF2272039.1 hypothetical protein [Streptomyces coacervatus]
MPEIVERLDGNREAPYTSARQSRRMMRGSLGVESQRAEEADKLKKNAPAQGLCVEGQAGTGGQVLPASAVVVVVVVLLITASLPAFGMPVEAAVTAVVAGGVMAKELIRGLVSVFSPHQA